MKHGTSVMYTRGACRCADCRTVHVRYLKKWRLDRQRGLNRMVDAEPLRQHVAQLLAAGMSFRGIALTAGWASRNSLESALSRARVRRSTFERIMAISPASDMRRHGYVDATGSSRRLQALVALGWPTRQLATHMGSADHGTVTDITSCNNRTIRRATADAIKALYDDLGMTQGPSRISAARAAKRGWLPPLCWDDDTIDDPAATPDASAVARPGRRTREELVEDFADLRSHGLTFAGAADRLGMSEQVLERTLYRAKADGFPVPSFGKEGAA